MPQIDTNVDLISRPTTPSTCSSCWSLRKCHYHYYAGRNQRQPRHFGRTSAVLAVVVTVVMWASLVSTAAVVVDVRNETSATTTTTVAAAAAAAANKKSTDELIRDIVLNQSAEWYGDTTRQHLLVEQLDQLALDTDKAKARDNRAAQFDLIVRSFNHSEQDADNLTIERKADAGAKTSAIDEFPPDFMSDEVRASGGFVVHILIFVYLSIALAVICDNYFLKSLEYISDALNLPSDIAGATFMAIGTSAPELFTSVIGVFISDNDIGTGTIVGSAVFNLIAIPGACGFAAYANLAEAPKITSFPIIRDTIFYVLTIITLILCIKDNQVDWIESVTLLSLYCVYIIVMYFNAQVSHIIEKTDLFETTSTESYGKAKARLREESLMNEANGDGQPQQQQAEDTEKKPLLSGKRKPASPPPAYASDIVISYPSLTTDASGKKVDTISATPKSLDYTHISLVLNENGKLKEVPQHQEQIYLSSHRSKEDLRAIKSKARADSCDRLNNNNNNEEEEEEDDEPDWSDSRGIKFLLLPFTIVFFFTLPKPTQFCFVLTFLSSICWIAALSYFIVWMVTLVGFTLGIPDTVSGITVLAAGTSIPELITSYLIVKKAGLADMAICNSIGSNIFDILFCLGLPWLLKTLVIVVTNGVGFATLASTAISIQSTALPLTSLTLLLTIIAMLVIFRLTEWRLSLRMGIMCFVVYILFVVVSTSLEFNV